MIRERQHEIDGSFITKNEIDDLKELKKILLYPTNKNATIKSRNRINNWFHMRNSDYRRNDYYYGYNGQNRPYYYQNKKYY